MSSAPPAVSTPRRRAATLWLTAGLGVLVLFGLGPSILDGVDAEHPWRSEVARHAAPTDLRPELTGNAPPAAASRIEDALAVLPAGLVRLGRERDAAVEMLTAAELNRRYPSHSELSENAGIYDPEKHVAYVATDGSHNGHTALHEYGHLVDDALGRPSSGSAFAPIYDEAVAQKRLRRYYVSSPAETFAELFARYYYSDRTRARLRREHPLAYEYFADLEARHLE